VDPMSFILTAFISSTLVPCHTTNDGVTVYETSARAVPVSNWPQEQERPEIPHLPHEELSLRVTVDSASGAYANSTSSTYTTSSTQLAWLRNDLSDRLIVISKEEFRGKSFYPETPPNLKLSTQAQAKPLNTVSRRIRALARSRC
jgi:hypothetical protein